MLGIIGGTGVYAIEGLEINESRTVTTPFGAPSAPLSLGRIQDQEVVFLPRHGVNHEFLPSEVNYRANIFALKLAGVTRIVGISAVGSLQEEFAMGDLAVTRQYFDMTRGIRKHSFFGDGMIAHVSTANPACGHLASLLIDAGTANGIKLHHEVTYACVEGPRLGTRSESLFFRGPAGCDVVGMTNLPEAFLAREAQMCYVTIAVITDYDCWQDDPEQHVSVAKVFETYGRSVAKVNRLLQHLLDQPLPDGGCDCRSSLQYAMLTPNEELSSEKLSILEVLRK